MPNLGDGDGFLRDEYAHLFEHDYFAEQEQESDVPPVLQDSGVTINFQKTNDQHYQKIEDVLHDLSKSNMVHFSPHEMQSMENDLAEEMNHDKMNVDFHGMRFHFNRDHVPSHWSAQQIQDDQYQYQSATPSIPEIAYYGVPLLLFTISIFVLMCALGICCGCTAAHYLSQKKKKEQEAMAKMLKYKVIPNEDGDAEPGNHEQHGNDDKNEKGDNAAVHIDL